MSVAVARNASSESTSKAKCDGERGALTKFRNRSSDIFSPSIRRKPICACGGGCPRCKERTDQVELEIGQPEDSYEREADRVAEQVMSLTETQSNKGETSTTSSFTPVWHRLQRRACAEPALAQPAVSHMPRAPGHPLDPSTRDAMELRFGHDFSKVRLHTDTEAAESAQAMNALAYTIGGDIVFGKNQYSPETVRGMGLLAHELTHVVQQDKGNAAFIQRSEARIHESIERYALTTDASGGHTGGLLTNEEASAVYYGNWMRDLNQVLVPMLQRLRLSPDVIFAAVSYLAAKKFGREMTPEQFGYYIPAEHIDSPAGLVAQYDLFPGQPTVSPGAAPQYPSRLGAARLGPFVTPQELVNPGVNLGPDDNTAGTVLGANIFSVDQAGVMAYIRRTNLHVERRLELAAMRGRNPEGMLHFGAALHAVEDLFAHSNFIEIAVSRLLQQEPALLPRFTGDARRVFTYSPDVEIGRDGAGRPVSRPVLTTGSFSSADTQISLATELVTFLRQPLPDPQTNAEGEAEERFIALLLRQFDNTLRNDPQFRVGLRDGIRNILQQYVGASAAGPIADGALQVSLEQVYQVYTWLPPIVPDWVKQRTTVPIQRLVRSQISQRVMRPLADQFQSEAAEAPVSGTSQIQTLRENLNTERGQFSERETATMRGLERLGAGTVQQQQQQAVEQARMRVQTLRATPEQVLAGPSHSQISKDHPNSPFFGLDFALATVAVRRLRDKMLAAWDENQRLPIAPFDFFGWSNWPQPAAAGAPRNEAAVYETARHLYHDARPAREVEIRGSLERGARIGQQGGDVEPGGTFQPYNLAAMRQHSANRLRVAAAALRVIVGSPGQGANVLQRVQSVLATVDDARVRRAQALIQRGAAAARVAGTSNAVVALNAAAADLEANASAVENARTHPEREAANSSLRELQGRVITALASAPPSAQSILPASVVIIVEEEIVHTQVAYSGEQRRVLEGRAHVPELPNPRSLTRSIVNLPSLTTDAQGGLRSPAVVALLRESRDIVNHPYEGTWWQDTVRQYVRSHEPQILADIEARNAGVAVFRRPN